MKTGNYEIVNQTGQHDRMQPRDDEAGSSLLPEIWNLPPCDVPRDYVTDRL
jgi:hypothetical protein